MDRFTGRRSGKRISQLVSGHLAPEDNPLRPTRFKEGLGKKGKTLMSHRGKQ